MSQQTVIGNSNLKFGCLQLAGNAWGQIENGSIELTGDEEGIMDSLGNFQAYLLTNDQYKVTFTTILPGDLALPARGARVDIPALNLSASLLSWKLNYQNKSATKLEITCAHWVAIGGAYGVGPAVTVLNDAGAAPPAAED